MADEGSVFDEVDDGDLDDLFGALDADREKLSDEAVSVAPPSDAPAAALDDEPGAPPEPAPAPAPEPAPAPAPAPEPVAAAPVQAVPEPTPAVAPASTPAPAAPEATPSPPAPSQEEIAAAMAQQQEYWTKQYALSEEEASAVVTDLPTVLPALAAKLHQTIREDIRRQMQMELPHMISRVTEGRLRETEAKQQFYSRWPQLANHSDAVIRTGQLFRAANPNATAAEATEAIGKIVCMSLGLQMGAGQQQQPPAPAQRPDAFRPAGAGGTPNPHAAAPPSNPWEAMAAELADDQNY